MKLPTPVDLSSLAKLILNPNCQSIGFLTGAGVSVASGIPDFRSPGGMYQTLQPQLLTATPAQRRLMGIDPTYVVTWEIFQENQFPYMEVRRPFILGTQQQKWKATIAHRFAELLHKKTSKLTRVYTQNIDGLDRQCRDIPSDKIVNVHGSIAEVECEGCGTSMDLDDFCNHVQTNIKDIYSTEENGDTSADGAGPRESQNIVCSNCQKPLVKPKTVLFGRSLPEEFFIRATEDMPNLDLLIVAGTSLVVSPANSLVYQVPRETKRVVVNMEPVGHELGIEYPDKAGKDLPQRDFFAKGECEKVFLELIGELGWISDLEAMSHLLPTTSQELLKEYQQNKKLT